MLHEIAPHVFDVEMAFVRPRADDCALAFREDETGRCLVMASVEGDGSITLPTCHDIVELCELGESGCSDEKGGNDCDAFEELASFQYLFAIDKRAYFLVRPHAASILEGAAPAMRDETFFPVRKLIARNGDPQAFAIATGMHLRSWYLDNQRCGRCGNRMEPSPQERALICSNCGHTVYSRISPAVIVAVSDGDRLLLTRYAQGEYRKRALVAGFVEVGETPEEAVAREVGEECGVRVKNVRYFTSQPWGLSGSLMLGFFVDLDGSPEITLQDGELDWAGWVPRDKLDDDDDYALGRVMVNTFRANRA